MFDKDRGIKISINRTVGSGRGVSREKSRFQVGDIALDFKKGGVLFKLDVYLTMYFVFSFFQVSKQLVKVIVTFYRRVISNFFRLQHGGNRFSIVVFQIRIQIREEYNTLPEYFTIKSCEYSENNPAIRKK